MAVCIIPARGGSKRIPHKNIKLFAGKPIIARVIAAARESGAFSGIYVSTDCDRIRAVAVEHGALAPFPRPAELADDFTPTAPVLAHALEALAGMGVTPDLFCCIYPTAVLSRGRDIMAGKTLLLESGGDTVFTVAPFPSSIHRALRRDERGRLHSIWPENYSARTQDLPEAFYDAGQFYWARTGPFLASRSLLTANSLGLALPRRQAVDIDTIEDWDLAERLFLLDRAGGTD